MKNAERRLKQLLKEKHVTVDQLATVTGKNRTTIYRYMNGDIANMPTTTLKQIAEYLNVSPGYIMGWTDDPTPGQGYVTTVITVDESGNRVLSPAEEKYFDAMHKLNQLTEEQLDAIMVMLDMFIAKNQAK